MAIDTARARSAALRARSGTRRFVPLPSGAVDQFARWQAGGRYAVGVSAVGVVTRRLTLRGASQQRLTLGGTSQQRLNLRSTSQQRLNITGSDP